MNQPNPVSDATHPLWPWVIFVLLIFSPFRLWADPDAAALVKDSFDHYRGQASQARIEMLIHRSSWERSMTMDAWTKGDKDSLVRIIAPAKDEGNATLKKGHEMYIYNPKVNRVIKLPPAMMAQAWMGSDFSNNDLSKTDSLLTDYDHTIETTETDAGLSVWVIKSMPKPMAPVVWGMQKLKIREDFVLLSQEFYDEDLQLVKTLTTADIRMMGGRMFPKIWRMTEVGKVDQYTELRYLELSFMDDLPDRLFTLDELKRTYRR